MPSSREPGGAVCQSRVTVTGETPSPSELSAMRNVKLAVSVSWRDGPRHGSPEPDAWPLVPLRLAAPVVSDAVQFVVHQRHQLLQGVLVALGPARERRVTSPGGFAFRVGLVPRAAVRKFEGAVLRKPQTGSAPGDGTRFLVIPFISINPSLLPSSCPVTNSQFNFPHCLPSFIVRPSIRSRPARVLCRQCPMQFRKPANWVCFCKSLF